MMHELILGSSLVCIEFGLHGVAGEQKLVFEYRTHNAHLWSCFQSSSSFLIEIFLSLISLCLPWLPRMAHASPSISPQINQRCVLTNEYFMCVNPR